MRLAGVRGRVTFDSGLGYIRPVTSVARHAPLGGVVGVRHCWPKSWRARSAIGAIAMIEPGRLAAPSLSRATLTRSSATVRVVAESPRPGSSPGGDGSAEPAAWAWDAWGTDGAVVDAPAREVIRETRWARHPPFRGVQAPLGNSARNERAPQSIRQLTNVNSRPRNAAARTRCLQQCLQIMARRCDCVSRSERVPQKKRG